MRVAEFDFPLPEELIAQEPLADRSAARMEHIRRAEGTISDRKFTDFADLLRPDDLVVFNNSRVFPARLYGRRLAQRGTIVDPEPANAPSGKIEVLLTRQLSSIPNEWEALVRPGRKIALGDRITFGDGQLLGEIIARGEFGERQIRFDEVPDFFARVEATGHIPLPPYISRNDTPADRERYQTVYARDRGSAAAPTAGLHFTPEILQQIHRRGIATTEITLHVGLGTFQPVRVENVEEHKIHAETYSISDDAAAQINTAMSNSRRIVAVGTTTVRALEHNALARHGKVAAGTFDANLFIYPGFKFQITGALLTNFHLPQSTLLMLVCAFGGTGKMLEAYRHAVEQRYRFYSYGDCMLIE